MADDTALPYQAHSSACSAGAHVSAALTAPAILGPPPAGRLRRSGGAARSQLALLHAAVFAAAAVAVAAVAPPQAHAAIGRWAPAGIAATTMRRMVRLVTLKR